MSLYHFVSSPASPPAGILAVMPRKRAIAPGPAAATLKELRLEVGLSTRAMATELGMETHTAYQYYESRYKKDYLPPALYKKVRAVLMSRGIKEDRVQQLLDADTRAELADLRHRVDSIESLIAEIAIRHAERASAEGEGPTVPSRSKKIH